MSEEPGEYEVESITEARVEKKKGRNPNLIWKFRVRWKGYSQNDDTWEPIESFDGSENIVTQFWEKTRDPRDVKDLNQFKAGESFLPLGPPRRKPTQKSLSNNDLPNNATKLLPQAESSTRTPDRSPKRRRESVEISDNDAPPVKRTRENNGEHSDVGQVSIVDHTKSFPKQHSQTPQIVVDLSSPRSSRKKSKKTQRPPSPEIVPDSDEEVENAVVRDADSEAGMSSISAHGPGASNSRSFNDIFNSLPSYTQKLRNLADSQQPSNTMLSEEPDSGNIPLHRRRNLKPLVQMEDDPRVVRQEGQISAKSRALEPKKTTSSFAESPSKESPLSHGSRLRPGPGRSSKGLLKKDIPSLLTFEKGTLKTVKGVYHKKKSADPTMHASGSSGMHDVNNVSQDPDVVDSYGDVNECVESVVPPTGEELLELAGLDTKAADDLPDFEEDVDMRIQTSEKLEVEGLQPDPSSSAQGHLASVNKAKESLFPSSKSPTTSGLESAPWQRSTIFGPLALGSEPSAQQAGSELTQTSSFSLNLDSSISIPVLFADATPPGSKLAPDISVAYKTPPGKFYNPTAALALLDTMRTGGSSARVLIGKDVSDELKHHFDRFTRRLEEGDLFIGMVGVQLLAFCSSKSTLISQRLNISPSLQGNAAEILVSRVIVENYSGYADAAANADSKQWSQYYSSV